jgi:hypothetical protein
MSKAALDLIPAELQAVTMSEAHIARAVALAAPTNEKTRQAADAHMRFEDEPARYYALLNEHGDPS